MNTTLRKFILFSAIGVALSGLVACRDAPPPKRTVDVLAEDSTLDLAVMSVNHSTISDSLAASVDSLSLAPGSASTSTKVSSASRVSSAKAARLPSRAAISTRKKASKVAAGSRAAATRLGRARARGLGSRRVAIGGRSGNRSKAIAGRNVRLANRGVRTPKSVALTMPRTSARPVGGTFIAGMQLSLLADQRVCSYASDIGNEFGAQVSEAVMGTNGTIIPRGATAIAEITSLGNSAKGDPIGLRIHSIVFAGKIYPVSSEVTYSEQEAVPLAHRKTNPKTVAAGAGLGAVLGAVVGGGPPGAVLGGAGGAAAGAAISNRKTLRSESCIPDRGRITARLSEPLTI